MRLDVYCPVGISIFTDKDKQSRLQNRTAGKCGPKMSFKPFFMVGSLSEILTPFCVYNGNFATQ